MERWYDLHMEPLREVTGAISRADLRIGRRHGTQGRRGSSAPADAGAHASLEKFARRHSSDGAPDRPAAEIGRKISPTEFAARLQALATSHDLLIQESWHGALLSDLVRSQLGHYLDREDSQISVEGPSVFLKPEAAQNIGLALHELATNAAKYGALSVPSGHVSITWGWAVEQIQGGEILWVERGGPAVSPPEQRGFGSVVIERNLAKTLDANVHLSFEPDGIQCRIVVPATCLSLVANPFIAATICGINPLALPANYDCPSQSHVRFARGWGKENDS